MFIAVEAGAHDRTLRQSLEQQAMSEVKARLHAATAHFQQQIDEVVPGAGEQPMVRVALEICRLQPDANDALRFAFEKLGRQHRGGQDDPRIVHALRVTGIVASQFQADDRQTVLTALLHDVLEDSDATAPEIARRFGRSIADGVESLTKPTRYPKSERRRIHQEKLATAADAVVLVKLADYADNLRCRRGSARFVKTLRSAAFFLTLLDHRRHLHLHHPIRHLEALLMSLVDHRQPALAAAAA
jgi:(p)ppGpp synthase/HD superfamily hydrolase